MMNHDFLSYPIPLSKAIIRLHHVFRHLDLELTCFIYSLSFKESISHAKKAWKKAKKKILKVRFSKFKISCIKFRGYLISPIL